MAIRALAEDEESQQSPSDEWLLWLHCPLERISEPQSIDTAVVLAHCMGLWLKYGGQGSEYQKLGEMSPCRWYYPITQRSLLIWSTLLPLPQELQLIKVRDGEIHWLSWTKTQEDRTEPNVLNTVKAFLHRPTFTWDCPAPSYQPYPMSFPAPALHLSWLWRVKCLNFSNFTS